MIRSASETDTRFANDESDAGRQNRSEASQRASDSVPGSGASKRYAAIVLAGTRPEGDPVADFLGIDSKAKAPLCGRPMIRHVLGALCGSKAIAKIMVIGNVHDDLASVLESTRQSDPGMPIELMAALGSISESVESAMNTLGSKRPFLVTTGDCPLLTPEMVDEFTRNAAERPGICIGLVDRETIQKVWPDTVRTYLKFRDAAVSGANLFTLDGPGVRNALRFWRSIEQDRKKTFKLVRAFGFANLVGMVFRRFSLVRAFERVGTMMGCEVRPIRLPVAEAAMDVDSVHDYFLAERILNSRLRPSGSTTAAGVSDPGVHRPPPGNGKVAVFDLDRTITKHGTFTSFLLSAQRSPVGQVRVGFHILRHMIGYKLRRFDRQMLKNRMMALALRGLSRAQVEQAADRFVDRILKNGIRQGFAPVFQRHREAGDRLVLATASIDLYANKFATHFGFDEVISTPTAFAVRGDQPLFLAGRNCYGIEKRARVIAALLPRGRSRSEVFITAYSDDLSDLPLLEWADAAIMICPTFKGRTVAAQRGIKVDQW